MAALALAPWVPMVPFVPMAQLMSSAQAQPDLSRKLGPTIADTGSAAYRFEHLALRSADGQRGYRVVVGVPRQPAPASGRPAIVLLDGNAALAAMDEALLQSLLQGQAPVLVAVGYDTDLRFDVKARAFDYTPPIPAGQQDEEAGRGRQGGGADIFLALLHDTILPRAQALAQTPLDPARMALWGHSYGGLLVLHTLFTRPQMFSRYIAASPSLWWQQGVVLQEERRFHAAMPAAARQARLWIMNGSDEARERAARPAGAAAAAARATPAPAPDSLPAHAPQQSMMASRAAMPAQALPELVARLRQQAGMTVDWRVFPGMAHGPMLPASLAPALCIAADLPPFGAG